jgi:predicted pyridoxine 5'-phosphate oxidase superfamily flavin-nucleotide-binding protein
LAAARILFSARLRHIALHRTTGLSRPDATATEPAMSHAFADLVFTPAVKAAQQRDGSRAGYARSFESQPELTHHRLGEDETAFIEAQRSFYLATVSETGWPYVQHRGGAVGFLKVLGDSTLAFADFSGNRQLVSVGNLAGNDRAALILVDYAQRVRLKLLGRLAVRDLAPGDPLFERLVTPGYRARPQRVFTISVEAFDWNCPQHIPQRFEAEDVERALAERDARIAELEARLAQTA